MINRRNPLRSATRTDSWLFFIQLPLNFIPKLLHTNIIEYNIRFLSSVIKQEKGTWEYKKKEISKEYEKSGSYYLLRRTESILLKWPLSDIYKLFIQQKMICNVSNDLTNNNLHAFFHVVVITTITTHTKTHYQLWDYIPVLKDINRNLTTS